MAALSFSGKRALVTGAGKGLGRATVVDLVKYGAEVTAISRTQTDLDSLKIQCPGIKTVCLDLGDWHATRKAVEGAGPIDLLVNNAGITKLDSVLDAKPEDFDAIMNVNVKAVMNVTQVVAKGMIERGHGGSIVMVSSICSQAPIKDHLVYCISKGGLDQMMRVFALELGPHQIRVNAVNPTAVLTRMGRMAWSDPVKAGPLLAKTPLGKFAEEKDVVNAVLYLLSDKSDMIHGQTLNIDGGFLAC